MPVSMDFEEFSSARDLLYLASVFFGAGAGCALNRFRRTASTGFRNRSVSAAFFFFSLAAASVTAAAVVSVWEIFFEPALYLPLGITVLAITAAFRFPKAAGFPLFIVSGIFIVWAGFICFHFPALDNSREARLTKGENGLVQIELVSFPVTERESRFYSSYNESDPNPEIKALLFSFPKVFPLSGGIPRGAFTEIRAGNKLLYADSSLFWTFYRGDGASAEAKENNGWLNFRELVERPDLDGLLPGAALIIKLEESGFVFR